MMNKSIGISAWAYYLPPKVWTLEDLEREKKIISSIKTLKDFGFKKIRISGEESSYEVATLATRKLFRDYKVSPKEIDLVIYSHALPDAMPRHSKTPIDLFKYPSTRLQYDLGMINANIITLSQAGCVSVLQAIKLARDTISADESINKILCVSADVLPPGSKREVMYNILSDAGCAVLVQRDVEDNTIIAYASTTKGVHWDSRESENEIAVSYFPTSIYVMQEALRKAKLTFEDIKFIVPHNVNIKSWEVLLRMAGVPKSKLYSKNIKRFGHTIAADAVINLSDVIKLGLISKGEYIMFFTYGFGSHWACMILQY